MTKFTQPPLPSVRNLLSVMFSSRLTDRELAEPWCNIEDDFFWLSRSAWSLLVVAKSFKCLTGQQSINVYVPDFFCNTSLRPLRSIGAKLIFYPIKNDMTPDMEVCHVMAKKEKPNIFIVVHYFGKPTHLNEVAEFCKATGAWMIEDAAHVLGPMSGIGGQGDFVLYSPHKLLPIPDGALLVFRKNGPAKLSSNSFLLQIFYKVSQATINKPGYSLYPTYLWLIKRILQKVGVRSRQQNINPFFTDANPGYSDIEHPKMNSMSKTILSRLLGTFGNVATMRKQNKMEWKQVLAKIPALVSKSIIDGQIPYLAEFIFENEALAEAAFLLCQKNGLPVTTWPDLPPEVLATPTPHLNALLLRNTRIYLPVHQTIKKKHISVYEGILNL